MQAGDVVSARDLHRRDREGKVRAVITQVAKCLATPCDLEKDGACDYWAQCLLCRRAVVENTRAVAPQVGSITM